MVKALVDYARGNAILHVLFLFFYGVITFVYGKVLWRGTGVHDTISMIPYSPESWGSIAIFCGLLVLLGIIKSDNILISVGCFLGSMWCFVFAGALLTDFFEDPTTPIALSGGLTYTYSALLMIHRSVLARKLDNEPKT